MKHLILSTIVSLMFVIGVGAQNRYEPRQPERRPQVQERWHPRYGYPEQCYIVRDRTGVYRECVYRDKRWYNPKRFVFRVRIGR